MPKVIQFTKTDSNLNIFFHVDEPPYTVAKVVKFKNQEHADDFKAKPVDYIVRQIPGFRIFLVHAGFLNKPDKHIDAPTISSQIQQIVNWYAKNKTTNKRERNYYQIK